MVYHSRHCSVIDTSQSPIKRLWDATKGMAEHHINNRNPKQECIQWLTDNGYCPIEGTEFWQKGKEVIVRWQAVYETKLVVPLDASLDSATIREEAANINLDCPGSTYQTDTWEVESITDSPTP